MFSDVPFAVVLFLDFLFSQGNLTESWGREIRPATGYRDHPSRELQYSCSLCSPSVGAIQCLNLKRNVTLLPLCCNLLRKNISHYVEGLLANCALRQAPRYDRLYRKQAVLGSCVLDKRVRCDDIKMRQPTTSIHYPSPFRFHDKN